MQWLSNVACCQLERFIVKGMYVDECKAEWYRRWKLPWPLYKSSRGIEADADGLALLLPPM